MQVVEYVLVEQVTLVEQEDRVDVLLAELTDMTGHLVENTSGGCLGRETQREADLAVEIAATEGGVVAVGQSEAGFGQPSPQRAQDARLANAGLAGEQDVGVFLAGLDQ